MKQVTKKKICFVSGGLDTNPNDPEASREPGTSGGSGNEGGEQTPYVPPLSPRVYFEPKSKVVETPGTPDPQADEEPEIHFGEISPSATKNNPFRKSDEEDATPTLPSDLAVALQNGKAKRVKLTLDNGKTLNIQTEPTEPTEPAGEPEEAMPEDSWTILGWTWKKKYWIMSGAGLVVLLTVLIILATKKN